MKGTVVYSEQERDFEPGYSYRNPAYFQGTQGNPRVVIVVGNWPEVAAAYRAIGSDVREVARGMPLGARTELSPPPEQGDDGSRQAPDVPPPPASPSWSEAEVDDQRTERELRQQFRKETGKAPSGKWSRDDLLSKLRESRENSQEGS